MLKYLLGVIAIFTLCIYAPVAYAAEITLVSSARVHTVLDKYAKPDFVWTRKHALTVGNLFAAYRFTDDQTAVYETITRGTKDPVYCEATVRGINIYASKAANINPTMYRDQATPFHLEFVLSHIQDACAPVKTAMRALRAASVKYHEPVSDSDYRICSGEDFRPFHDTCLSRENDYVSPLYEEFASTASKRELRKLCRVSDPSFSHHSIASQYLQLRFPNASQCKRKSLAFYFISSN